MWIIHVYIYSTSPRVFISDKPIWFVVKILAMPALTSLPLNIALIDWNQVEGSFPFVSIEFSFSGGLIFQEAWEDEVHEAWIQTGRVSNRRRLFHQVIKWFITISYSNFWNFCWFGRWCGFGYGGCSSRVVRRRIFQGPQSVPNKSLIRSSIMSKKYI